MGKIAGSMGLDLLKKMRLAVIDRIVEEMTARSWDQEKLAEKCEVSSSTISRKLNKSDNSTLFSKITVEDIEMFANAFDIEAAALFPIKFVDEIHEAFNTMPLIDLMRIICRKEIEKYFANQK